MALFNSNKKIVKMSNHGLDTNAARIFLDAMLSLFESTILLYKHEAKISWGKTVYVKNISANSWAELSDDGHAITKRQAPPYDKSVSLIKRKLSHLFGSYADASMREKVGAAMATHAIALRSPKPETQLITLWSALESLLPPMFDKSGIDGYLRHIKPAILIGYPTNLLKWLFSYLRQKYRSDFMGIINNIQIEGDLLDKFSAAILLETNKGALDSIKQLSDVNNPLAAYQINKIIGSYDKPSNIKHSIELHWKKVEWQLHRIYRWRNAIIHAGHIPDNIETMICSLHDYFDTVSTVFDIYCDQSVQNRTVGDIFGWLEVDCEFYIQTLDRFIKDGDILNETNLRHCLARTYKANHDKLPVE